LSENGGPGRRLPDRSPASFDVTGWVAGLSTGDPGSFRVIGEKERAGVLTVTYECEGEKVDVLVRRAGGVAAAAWELTADFGNRVERIVLPGGVRFIWRAAATRS
jgi:hypothetical protein